MSDKKTIQEALAEVQRNAELMEAPNVFKLFGRGAAKVPKSAPIRPMPHGGEDLVGKAKQAPKEPPTIDLKAEKPKTTTPNVPEAPKSTIKDFGKAVAGAGLAAGAGYAGYNAFTKGAVNPPTEKFTKDEPKAEKPKAAETPKAPEAAKPQTFGQAFAAARKAAEAKGAKTSGQFEFQGKKYQTNLQGTGTTKKPQEKYVSMSKQTKVDVSAPKAAATPTVTKTPETPKPAETSKAPEASQTSPAPKAPEALGKTIGSLMRGNVSRAGEGAKEWVSAVSTSSSRAWNKTADAFDPKGAESESGYSKKGKTKMSEENEINEAMPLPPRRPGQTGSSMIQRGDTLSSLSKRSGLSVADIMKQNPNIKDPNKISAGASINLQKPEQKTVWKDPVSAGYDKPAQTTTTSPNTTKSWDSDIPKIDKGPTTSAAPTPTPAPSTSSSSSMLSGTPVAQQRTLEKESGGKKKVAEENSPLIAAFLDLQAKNPANMFEAAKKAKKDYDRDGKVESPKDEVWGSRFRAAKAAGKMAEGVKADPNDPSYQGGGDVTSTPEKKTSMPKPTAPKTDSSVQGSGDVTMNGKPTRVKEEVTFSQAEIDHINSFFLEASVAPNRPEVAIGADSTSDKMSQNDVTATAESGKKIRKEEVEVDEGYGNTPSVRSFGHDPLSGGRGRPRTDVATKGERKGMVKKSTQDSMKRRIADRLGSHAKANLPEETLEEGRPKKNPTPETTERDPRKHIQVEAGRAAAGNVVDFTHNDGSRSKITPAMGRKIVSHLQGLKPADRQTAVNKMHDSAEGLKV
jgi:hypothetical protein